MLPELIPDTARRVHLLRARGALRDDRGELIPYLYVGRDPEPEVPEGDVDTVQLARELLCAFPGLHVSVASPLKLLDELFTVKGQGTVIRAGSIITRHAGLGAVDRDRLTALLEDMQATLRARMTGQEVEALPRIRRDA